MSSMRDLVSGSDVCTPSDGAGPSNAVGGLVNTLLGGSSKAQEQLRELPTFQPNLGGRNVPLTPESAAMAAAMQPGVSIPGLAPSTMDRAGAEAFMRGPSQSAGAAPAHWDGIFGGQGMPQTPQVQQLQMQHQQQQQQRAGPSAQAGAAPLEQHLQAFVAAARGSSHFTAGPLTPQLTAGLSTVDKCRIRDRATILSRQMFADMGERFAEQQVGNLLASMHINPADLPAQLPHVHAGDWHDAWRDASSAAASGSGRVASDMAAGAQHAPWDTLWDQQHQQQQQQQQHRPQQSQSSGWAAEFQQQQPGVSPWAAEFQQQHPQHHMNRPPLGRMMPAPPQVWADEFHRQQQPTLAAAPAQASGWADTFQEEQLAAAAVQGVAAAQRGRDGSEASARLSTSAVVDQLSRDPDPKMRSSKFLHFMSKMSRGEIMFDDNKVVERPATAMAWANEFSASAAGPAGAWGNEFQQQQQQQRNAPSSWASDFQQQQQRPANGWASEFSQQQQAPGWASEFADGQQRSGNGAAAGPMTAEAAAGAWASEFAAKQRSAAEAAAPLTADWADEFARGVGDLKLSDDAEAMHSAWADANGWADEFNRASEEENFQEWERIYGHGQVDTSYGSSKGEYVFATTNPFLGDPEAEAKGRDLFRRGVLTEAVLALEAAVRAEPGNANAWRLLGTVQAENDDDRQAIAAMVRALGADPLNLDVLLSLGVSHTNELDQNEALDYLTRWLAAHPDYADVAARAGPPPDSSQRVSHVVHQFEAASRLKPEDAELYQALGVLAHLSRQYSTAVSSFQRALQLRPQDYSLWNKLGATLANHAQSSDAVGAYQKALDLKPNYMRAWTNMGISFANLGDYEKSARFYVRALTLNPNASHVWGYLRTSLACAGMNELMPAVDGQDLALLQGKLPL